MSTYPSIHFSLDEDTLEITVGCLVFVGCVCTCGVVCGVGGGGVCVGCCVVVVRVCGVW